MAWRHRKRMAAEVVGGGSAVQTGNTNFAGQDALGDDVMNLLRSFG